MHKEVKNVKQQRSIHAVNKTVAFGVQIFMKVTFFNGFTWRKQKDLPSASTKLSGKTTNKNVAISRYT
jgi:hypothetical protein